MRDLVIYCCGGFGREVSAAARAGGWNVLAFVDDGARHAPSGPVPLLGDFAAFRDWLDRSPVTNGPTDARERVAVFVATGNIRVHKLLTARLEGLGDRIGFPSIVHPHATLDPATVRMGRGCYVGAGARLTADVTLGDFVLVNVNTVIAHDSTVGDRSLVNPGAVVNGNVRVGREVVVGAGSVLLHGITVGDEVVIGLGAVAGLDVPDGATVVGNPGRVLRRKVEES